MTPDAMNQQFGEYSAVEIARHVADLRSTTTTTTSSSARSWHVTRPRHATSRRVARLMSRLTTRLHAHTEPGTVEPAPPHAIPMSR